MPLEPSKKNLCDLYSIDVFNKSLFKKLLCTNDFENGVYYRKKKFALEHDYISFNDKFIKFLVLDIDYFMSFFAWYDYGCPEPHIIVQNEDNSHCHYIYALDIPICKTDNARLKPLKYFARIQQAYTQKLKADPNFAGLLTKNPNSDRWRVYELKDTPAYSLEFLADYVVLPKRLIKREIIGEGRNCFLFDSIRKIAYREVLFYKAQGARLDDFHSMILSKLQKLNVFENSPPLPFNELKHIAKSVSRWTWRNFSASQFSEIQSKRIEKRWGKLDATRLKHDFS